MKICVIGKLSPIQGGVSKLNLWMCQALAQAGHTVHIVTNGSEVEDQYRTVGGKISDNLSNSPLEGLSDRVTIHYTNENALYSYIPFANPFVTKLSSIAIDVVRKHKCDLIFGHYFEPYGVAAYIVAKATGVPFGLQPAGSDVGRLMQSPEMRTMYAEIIKSADYIFTSNSTRRRFIAEGADPYKLYPLPRSTFADAVYTPDVPNLDLVKHVTAARSELKNQYYLDLLDQFPVSNFDASLPTIGIYGKTGETKGSYDLIESLRIIKLAGKRFNFLALTSSGKKTLDVFVNKLVDAGLSENTIWLPFVPYWQVPEFIKICNVITFLERDFPIPIHHPAVALEIMQCAGCLIVSTEIANKQRYKKQLQDRVNVSVVNPKNHIELAEKILWLFDNPEEAKKIGTAAREVILEFS